MTSIRISRDLHGHGSRDFCVNHHQPCAWVSSNICMIGLHVKTGAPLGRCQPETEKRPTMRPAASAYLHISRIFYGLDLSGNGYSLFLRGTWLLSQRSLASRGSLLRRPGPWLTRTKARAKWGPFFRLGPGADLNFKGTRTGERWAPGLGVRSEVEGGILGLLELPEGRQAVHTLAQSAEQAVTRAPNRQNPARSPDRVFKMFSFLCMQCRVREHGEGRLRHLEHTSQSCFSESIASIIRHTIAAFGYRESKGSPPRPLEQERVPEKKSSTEGHPQGLSFPLWHHNATTLNKS